MLIMVTILCFILSLAIVLKLLVKTIPKIRNLIIKLIYYIWYISKFIILILMINFALTIIFIPYIF